MVEHRGGKPILPRYNETIQGFTVLNISLKNGGCDRFRFALDADTAAFSNSPEYQEAMDWSIWTRQLFWSFACQSTTKITINTVSVANFCKWSMQKKENFEKHS